MNFNNIKINGSIHKDTFCNEYAFPIIGLYLEEAELEIGFAKIIRFEKFKKENQYLNYSGFENETIMIIKTENLNVKENKSLNSLALKYAKEVIGYLYFLYYININKKQDKKIIISQKKDTNFDEGLVSYFEKYNKYHLKKQANFDSIMNIKEISKFINNKSIFEIPLENRTEYQSKIFKSFEFLYYIYNEIYAIERANKYFLIFNHLIRESDKKNLNIKGISRFLNFIFKEDKNFKCKEFEDKYQRLRNNYLHGIFKANEENIIISEEDFVYLRKIFMKTLDMLLNNEEFNKCKNTAELIKYIVKKN